MNSSCSGNISSMSSVQNSNGRMLPTPLSTLPSAITNCDHRRARSSTMTSLDSTMTSTSSYTNNSTPIRPRPILPSSYSFDSGFEVSPLFSQSFRFGDSTSFPVDHMAQSEVENNNLDDNDDSINGFDEELISIEQTFAPISVPNCTNNNTSTAFSFTSTNLANQRRNNRMSHHLENEINNNDILFPNQNQPHAIDEDMDLDMMFYDDDDDDVFYNEDEEEEFLEPRSWHIPRPTCTLSESGPDFYPPESISSPNSRGILPSEESITSSRRSSTPIPIPGSTSGSENSFDGDAIDSFDFPSVPQPRTRMPYYHQHAAPLNIPNPLNDIESDGNQNNQARANTRRTTFGTHFETSCSIISRNLVPSRFSPVPFLNHWNPPNHRGLQPRSIWLRFGQLPSSPTYPIRAIPNDFRSLTPHYEVDENEPPSPAAASSYGLVFNFSQLAVNEISGEQMDLEVDSSQPTESMEPRLMQTDLASALFPNQQPPDDLNRSRTLSLDIVPRKEREEQTTRDPLPDIVASLGCHRSASFTNSSTTSKHRNTTLPSFHELPYSTNSTTNNFQERRTMSVSLPIEEQVISHVAQQLRQISNDFSSRQIQRYNPLSPVFDLLSNTLYGSPHRNRSTVSRSQTFAASNTRTTSTNNARIVNNSRFYTAEQNDNHTTEPPPTPTTTGNSTFYVGTTTTTKAPHHTK